MRSEAFTVLRPEAYRIAGIVLNKVDIKRLSSYGYHGGYPYGSFSNLREQYVNKGARRHKVVVVGSTGGAFGLGRRPTAIAAGTAGTALLSAHSRQVFGR